MGAFRLLEPVSVVGLMLLIEGKAARTQLR
jgi:hypothetical protein